MEIGEAEIGTSSKILLTNGLRAKVQTRNVSFIYVSRVSGSRYGSHFKRVWLDRFRMTERSSKHQRVDRMICYQSCTA